MQKKSYFGPYKGAPLLVLIFGPLLAIALWVFFTSAITLSGENEKVAMTESHVVGVFAGGIMAALFLSFLIWGHFIGARQAREEALKAKFPNEPWKWKLQWHDKEIKPESKRAKNTAFRMTNQPAAIGHMLQGHLFLADQPPKGSKFKFSLRNVVNERVEKGRRERILWEDTQDIPVSKGSQASRFYLPVAFKVPPDGIGSDWSDTREQFLWKLSVKAGLPGTDYDETFELPVYDPDLYDFPVPTPLNEAGEIAGHIYQDKGDWRDTQTRITTTTEGQVYDCPSVRLKLQAVLCAFLFLSLLAMLPFPFIYDGWITGALYSLFLSPFILVTGALALDFWFSKTRFVVKDGRLDLSYGLRGRKRASFSVDKIRKLEVSKTLNPGETAYYDIIAKLKGGESYKLAARLQDKRDVVALKDKIADEVGYQ